MADTPLDPNTTSPSSGPDPSPDFRWTAFFQRSTEPVFVVNRRRQILFVNRAWESLTGFSGRDVYTRLCKRRRDAEPGSCEALLSSLSPTREALEGQPARVRRLVARLQAPPRWWDVEFFPLLGGHGVLGLVGKIHPVATAPEATARPLPEKLVALKQRLTAWWGVDKIPADVPAMRRVAEQVRLASRTSTAVLLVGEPGSGKEWLARTIHRESPHRENPFIALDCRHLPAAALAWTLFGPPGLAHRPGTTLYLKAPSLLPRELQSRLCEHLTTAVDEGQGPRLLAGTAAEAAGEMQADQMLEDFHCLLSPLTIHVPALRERLADLPILVERMLRRAASGHDSPVRGLTDEAWELVRGYPWPGNLRELYAVLAGACHRAKGESLEAGDLPWFMRSSTPPAERSLPLDKTLEQVERRLLQLAMVMAKGNKSRAAQILEIPRSRLLRRLQVLGLT
jgi:transcriptional regulator with PAS, ATPase and Fis domain